jgi:hypothetical protein
VVSDQAPNLPPARPLRHTIKVNGFVKNAMFCFAQSQNP